MSNAEVIRAWKDPEYRNSLSSAAASLLPENPAGKIEIGESQAGGKRFLRTTIVSSCVPPGTPCP